MAIIRSISPKFVFVHVPKNAGMSIGAVLRESEADYYKIKTRSKHDTAVVLRDLYPDFKRSFTFAFVRNPWDRLVSLYHFVYKRKHKLVHRTGYNFSLEDVEQGFNHWLLNTELFFWYDIPGVKKPRKDFVPTYPKDRPKNLPTPHQKRNQTYWLCDDNGEVIVDFIGRVENVDTDLRKVYRSVHLPIPQALPKRNQTQHDKYQKYYSRESREFVEYYFKKDLEMFNYTY